jgi:hypothetical protein
MKPAGCLDFVSTDAKRRAVPDIRIVRLFGNEVKYTKRYKLGQLVGGRARHFLLMSATPHNGSDADFQLFMGLLDADRFEGRPREGARKVDVSDLMRRLIRERSPATLGSVSEIVH